MGNLLQIDAELNNIIARNEVNNCPLRIGDSILKLEDKKINSSEDFYNTLSSINKNTVSVLVKRNNSLLCLKCNKNILNKINFNEMISGFATLTYINPDSHEFAAVAHPISFGSNRQIGIKNGFISYTDNLNIKKSSKGNVGCVNAIKNKKVGSFDSNTAFGIKGTLYNIDLSNCDKYKVASIKDVHTGKAHIILQNKDNVCKKYEIEIISVENQRNPHSRGIKFKVTDSELLKNTGGIVQGMSGTPIVQGNKIVGAISHALESNPTVGYAVHIKWMLQENN